MSNAVRVLHRWVSAAFVVAVVAVSIALAQKEPVAWISYLPLLPLALLTLSGAYLFVLPYVRRRRGASRGDQLE